MAPHQTELFADVARHAEPPAATHATVVPSDLPDSVARQRIRTDLNANLLVEAGAGAGKTTEMVHRMVALVRTGHATVDRIAAVTFTRKAASELRERFQTHLERELLDATGAKDIARVERIDTALREIDRAWIGTIHSFCARMLRDRALEVGLDPGFHETFAVEQERLRHEFFTTHIERLAAAGNPILADLANVGLRPQQLRRLFEELSEHADVEFDAEDTARPDPAAARLELERLLDDAAAIMPADEPRHGWDDLQRTIRRLRFYREIVGWDDDITFLHALAESLAAVPRATYRRWGGPGAVDVAKELERRFRDYAGENGPGGRVLRQWWAHRYPVATRFARNAARHFAQERLRTGALSFQDLLMGARDLLRSSTIARAELGERFRFLLVDEFQDTDPIQAEVLLLLASDPAMDESAGPQWRRAVPRAGALFVVGDPKQSIYRFRRADMSIYNQVKRRFGEFGAVLELYANFRSGPPVERLVDDVFAGRFPGVASEYQAAFSPLRVQKPPGEKHRVAWYPVLKPGRRPREEEIVAQDAVRVASWIEERVRDGQRKPGDFLILTRKKRHLMAYARAIEARNVAVQVTGAGVGIEVELSELRVLLEALADPGDPTLTIAALAGLFFGIDFDRIADWLLPAPVDSADVVAAEHRSLDFTSPPADTGDVADALRTLHELWMLAATQPADVVVATIVDRFGLLPWAAAGELGDSRAGALLYVLETVRHAALQGDASLGGALTAIDAALSTEEAEAPLEPGRSDAVRVMNLHQAKGLEAEVVVLAAPIGEWNPAPTLHVTRPDQGEPQGRIVVAEKRWRFNDTILACPADWSAHAAEEQRFVDAERDRLLYVAATRAKDELLVARYEDEAQSPWSAFHPYLEPGFPRLELEERPAPERARLARSAASLGEETAAVNAARAVLASATYRAEAVTRRVKGVEGEAAGTTPGEVEGEMSTETRTSDDGQRWGKLLHAALEVAGRGADETAVRAFTRTLVADPDLLPLDLAPDEHTVDLIVSEVRKVTQSDIWKRAERAAHRLIEVPFAIAFDAAEWASLGGGAGPARDAADASTPEPAPLEIVEGVIDLAFRDDDGWTLVDYKSDREGAALDDARRARYRAQVDLYAACWTRITGEPVGERVLLFVADGATDSW